MAMNPKWKLGVFLLLLAIPMLWPASAKRNSAARKAEPDYKNKGTKVKGGLLKRLGAE
jgi:hypothetical protein